MDDQRENQIGGNEDENILYGSRASDYGFSGDLSRVGGHMSLAWEGDDRTRPAGEGPLMQEFYAGVARAMLKVEAERRQQAMQEFAAEVARSQRGDWLSHWREIVTAAGAVGFWIGCWWLGGHLG